MCERWQRRYSGERKMMRRRTILLGLVATFLVATVTHAQHGPSHPWKRADVGTAASFRGLSVVSEDVVWASGTQGTVIRTVDSGKTWTCTRWQARRTRIFAGFARLMRRRRLRRFIARAMAGRRGRSRLRRRRRVSFSIRSRFGTGNAELC